MKQPTSDKLHRGGRKRPERDLPQWAKGQRITVKTPFALPRSVVREIQTSDLYHRFLRCSWPAFAAIVFAVYLALNAAFALAYMELGGISHARPGDFGDAFFFSVQIMATIGYGGMMPQTTAANVVVTIESMVGLLSLPLLMALVFARLSRPTARVVFGACAVIAPYDGIPTLMIRAANQRGNQILQAQVRITLVRAERSREGMEMRRIYDLPLVRDHHSVFSLTWTMMHPIIETSPLYGYTPEMLEAVDGFFVVLLAGIDDTFNQTVHARYLYGPKDVRWNHRFTDVFVRQPDGSNVADYTRFHETEPMAAEVEFRESRAGGTG